MGDDDGGAVFGNAVERFLDAFLGANVDGGCGFVEDEDWWALDDAAGYGDALALAAREFDAGFADEGVVALGEISIVQ